jgi:hypothetical protein
MALSPYQAPPFRTMDDAQHTPTSAQHGAKHTMANVALTQTIVHLRHYNGSRKVPRVLATWPWFNPSHQTILLTHHPPPPEANNPCLEPNRQNMVFLQFAGHVDLDTFWHGYTLLFSAPRAEYTTM